MTASITTLEQLLERYGDTLYRIAILFAASPAQAHELLLRFARSHITAPIPSDDQQLISSLLPFLAELPERRQANTQHALRPMLDNLPAADAHLLTAILKLPRAQRAALAFLALQLPFEEGQQLDQQPLADLRRDALLALAPVMNRPTLAAALTNPEVDELCRTTRAALILEEIGQHHTAAVRGHLALCTDCRALSQSWQGLIGQLSDGLRSVLRTVHMPEEFGERMLAAAEPTSSQGAGSILRSPWLVRMVLPVLVLSLIALLVFWRAPEEPSTPILTGAAPVALKTLITRAYDTLYTSQAEGIQHQYYQMRWPFGDGSYAPLVGQIWRDPASNQLRAQLTHESGGAPYEFLMTGRGTAWYAVTNLYGESIYPLLMDAAPMRAQFQLTEQQLRDLSQATFAKGAWGIPQLYLEQAQSATLQSWGRQRTEDGTLVEVIGFRSDTAFSMQAQTIDNLQVTVLLMIDPVKGQLREVREVFGPPGGDQVSRTLWRFVASETLTDEQLIGRSFNMTFAWNGTGDFKESQFSFIHPALPLVSQNRLSSLSIADGVLSWSYLNPSQMPYDIYMPTAAPDKATRAFLLSNTAQGSEGFSILYLGQGREFIFRNMLDTPANQALFPTDQGVETVTIGNYRVLMRRVPGGYMTLQTMPTDGGRLPMLVFGYASGYSREQVLATLATLQPLAVDTLQQQMELFSSTNNPNGVHELLLTALTQEKPQPGPEQVRRTHALIFTRQSENSDRLSDPYHRLPYDGVSVGQYVTKWLYPGTADRLPYLYLERRDADDRLYEVIDTDATLPRAYSYAPEPFLLAALICGGGQLSTGQGESTLITFSVKNFSESTCLWPGYQQLMLKQLQGNERFAANEPYLADLGDTALTLTLTLDKQHVLTRAETTASLGTPVVLKSWQLEEDKLIPLAEAPTTAYRGSSVKTLSQQVEDVPTTFLLQQVTMSDTLKIAGGRLLVPEQPDQASYFVAVSQPLVGSNFQAASNSVFELALWEGVATQLVLPVQQSDGQAQDFIIYQGPAQAFREFLQHHASWQSSAPTTGRIAGQTVDGWMVFTGTDQDYMLAELDGLLLVIPRVMTAEQQKAIDGLRMLGK